MRKLSILFLLLLPNFAFGQDETVRYFLNGKEFKWDLVFLNPANVKSLNVVSEKKEIYFVMKEKNWKYKSLSGLLKTLYNYPQITADSIIPIFIIKGKVIKDPDNIKIDDTYFGNAILKPLSSVNQISENCKKLVLVDIDLSDNPKKWDKVRGYYQYLDIYKEK